MDFKTLAGNIVGTRYMDYAWARRTHTASDLKALYPQADAYEKRWQEECSVGAADLPRCD